MSAVPQTPPPGLTVGGYELRARLGEGGMGVVHLGQRPGERPVAIKVLRPQIVGDDEARRRLAREVGSLSRVRNRRIAEIVDADPWGDVPYVATRYVPGLSLHDHVHEEGPLEGRDLVWFADCLAEAVQAVHSVGVLHRDIKPSNVIMEGRTPILIDFGLARVADDPRITMTGWLLGTPGFLAPEILHGDDATAASDVHSWAATVAFAGTGRSPFGRGPSAAIMDRVRRGDHALTGLDSMLVPLVEDALDPDPAARPSLAELREWLAEIGSGRSAPRVRPPTTRTMPLSAVAWRDQEAEPEPSDESETDLGAEGWDGHDAWLDDEEWDEDQDPTERFHDPSYEAAHMGVDPDDSPRRAGTGERLRRGVLVLAGLGVVANGFALAPYVALVVLAVLAWLLRSGSLAASAVGERRRLRGARWYDGAQVLVGAPWHLTKGLAGTLLLVLWSVGLAAAAALLCFAASLEITTSVAVVGAVFGLAMWWGPGGERIRWPVHRAVDPVARRPVTWLLATVLVVALGTGMGAAASGSGTDWTPDDSAPFADVRLPSWL